MIPHCNLPYPSTFFDISVHTDVFRSYLTDPALLPHLSGALFWEAAISAAISAMSSDRIVLLPHLSGDSLKFRTTAVSSSETERLPHLIMDESGSTSDVEGEREKKKGRHSKF